MNLPNHPNDAHQPNLLILPFSTNLISMNQFMGHRRNIDYERLEHYVSVKAQIVRQVLASPSDYTVIDVEEFLKTIAHKIHNHYDSEVQSFTDEEKKWLAERLCWGHFLPNLPSARYFPGRRPHNPQRRRYHVEPCVFPPCKTCVEWRTDDKECPFVEVKFCRYRQMNGHKEYKVRLGAEPRVNQCATCVKNSLLG